MFITESVRYFLRYLYQKKPQDKFWMFLGYIFVLYNILLIFPLHLHTLRSPKLKTVFKPGSYEWG